MSVAPTTMKKGDASLFVVSAFITNPSASLEFAIYQPLGYSVSGNLSLERDPKERETKSFPLH